MKYGLAFIIGLLTGILGLLLAIVVFAGRENVRSLPGLQNTEAPPPFQYKLSNFNKSDFSRKITFQHNGGYIEAAYVSLLDTTSQNDACLQVLNDAYTTGLLPRFSKTLQNVDSSFALLAWAEELQLYTPRRIESAILFESISGFWFQAISDRLKKVAEAQPEIRYSFPFRYLVERCAQHKYFVDLPEGKLEKGVRRMVESKIGYVIGRVFLDVSPTKLIGIILAGAFTLVAWAVLIYRIFLYFRAKKSGSFIRNQS